MKIETWKTAWHRVRWRNLLKPLRLAIFSIWFVDNESFSHAASVDSDASIFSMLGIWAYNLTSFASDALASFFSSYKQTKVQPKFPTSRYDFKLYKVTLQWLPTSIF